MLVPTFFTPPSVAGDDNPTETVYLPAFDQWTAFSYADVDPWRNDVLLEKNVLYYQLNSIASEYYAVDSSLTSPRLTLAENTYTFSFSYYTRMRSATPNVVTLSYSEDGVEFLDADYALCTDTNDEFKTQTFSFTGKPLYLKLTVRNYYAKDSLGDAIRRGMYFDLDTAPSLETKAAAMPERNYFVITVDKREFVFNGEAQTPAVTLLSNYDDDAYYYTTVVTKSGEETSSVHAGDDYALAVNVYNRANRFCFSETFDYQIHKSELVLPQNGIEYYLTDDAVRIVGLTLTDKQGKKADVDAIDGISFGIRENKLGVSVDSPDYEAFESFEIPVGDINNVVCPEKLSKSVSFVYNGESVSFMPIDGAQVDFYRDDEKIAAVKNVGFYEAKVTAYEKTFSYTVVVEPKTLTEGLYSGENLIKKYDGNTALFGENGEIKRFGANDLIPTKEVCAGDDVSFVFDSVEYARDTGKNYLVAHNLSLTGSAAKNYRVGDDFRIVVAEKINGTYYEKTSGGFVPSSDLYFSDEKTYYSAQNDASLYIPKNIIVRVDAINAVLVGETDGTGHKITVADKVFDPLDASAEYENTTEAFLNRSLPVYGARDLLTYKDVAFAFRENAVGKRELALTLINERYFDRYLPEVLTVAPLYGIILTKELPIDGSRAEEFMTGLTKIYDGTTTAEPLFTGLIPQEKPDDFPTFGTDFTVECKSAVYEDASAGADKEITVAIAVTALNTATKDYFSNYSFPSFTVRGEITKKPFEVYSEYIRVSMGENPKPNVKANADPTEFGCDVFDVNTGKVTTKWKNAAGSYSLHVYSTSDNFVMAKEFEEVPLVVVEKEKARQKIVFPSLDLSGGTSFVMLCGSTFDLDAISVTEDNKKTDLNLTYTVDDPYACVMRKDGVLTASAVQTGTFTLTVSQPGNNYYHAADDVTLTVSVVTNTLFVTIDDDPGLLYAYDSLPVLADGTFTVARPEGTLSGVLTAGSDILSASKTLYTYYFTPDRTVTDFTADFSIKSDYYVADGNSYVKADETFSVFDEYYIRIYSEADVSLKTGEAIPNGYYEKNYIVTEDDSFIADKDYYKQVFSPDANVPTGHPVAKGVYYERTPGSYAFFVGRYFTSAHSAYYTVEFTEADAEEGEPVRGDFYEETDGVFRKTTDGVFATDKTYYVAENATLVSFNVGEAIPDGAKYYYLSEDEYNLTRDVVFAESKNYYRLTYALDEHVVPDTAVDGVYYEIGDVFVPTDDNVFQSDKTYYTAEYKDVHFIANGAATSSLYYEKSEQGAYSTTGDATFDIAKEYFISTWTPYKYTGLPDYGIKESDNAYERSVVGYYLTKDETFVEGKSYYLLLEGGEYVLAVTKAGEPVKDRPYYENGGFAYTPTADETWQVNKTYYIMSYNETIFLDADGSLPDGEFFRKADAYGKTSDSVFSESTLYYTVSYRPVQCEGGTHVDGEYYVFDDETEKYVKETERYFAHGTDYFVAVYTPDDVRSRFTIDPFDTYYVGVSSDEVYREDVSYYLLDDDEFVLDEAVAVGSFTDGNHFIKSTASKFDDGVKYYCYSVPFIGVAPVGVTLSVRAPVVTVYMCDEIVTEYGKEVDFYDFIEKVTLTNGAETRTLPFDEGMAILTDGKVSFTFAAADEKPVSALLPDIYEAACKEDIGRYLRLSISARTDNRTIVLADKNFSFRVDKAHVAVSINDMRKFYGEGNPDKESARQYLAVDNLPDEAVAALKQNFDVLPQAYTLTDSGEYPVFAVVNDSVSADSAVPGGVYEMRYVLSSDQTVSDGKDYFLLQGYEKQRYEKGNPIGSGVYEATYKKAVGEPDETKTYYALVSYAPVHPEEGENVPSGVFYQDSYTLCADETFIAGKAYYVLDYTAETDLTKQNVAYYTQTFVPTEDEVFITGKSYFLYTDEYVLATVTSGEAVTDGYFESRFDVAGEVTPGEKYFVSRFVPVTVKAGDDATKYAYYTHSFVLTEDTTFRAEKTYYLPMYAAANVDEEKWDEGEYFLPVYNPTSDTEAVFGKEYFLPVYTAAAYEPGHIIGDEKLYEKAFSATADSVFVAGKTYYKKVSETQYALLSVVDGDTVTVSDGVLCFGAGYVIDLAFGFIVIDPIALSVTAKASHVFGRERAEILPDITVLSEAGLTEEEKADLTEEVGKYLTVSCKVTADSDSGDYPITFDYLGKNRNMAVTTKEGVYTVEKARLNADPTHPDFVFDDENVVYDGEYHTLTVRYDDETWQGVTIAYNMQSCKQIGNYAFVATVSKKNYYDLTLSATLCIETRVLESSNKAHNALSLTIADENKKGGVVGSYRVRLAEFTDETDGEKAKAARDLLATVEGLPAYSVVGIYGVETYDGGDLVSLDYSSYTVSLSATDFAYGKGLILLGYTEGAFGKIDFEYKNGEYTFSLSGDGTVDPLGTFVFVRENTTVETKYPLYTYWVLIIAILAIIALILIVVIGSLVKSSKQSATRRRRAIKRLGRR